LCKLSWIAHSDSTGKAIGQFDLVKLVFDGLAQLNIIDIAENEQRFCNLAKSFEGLVERVLPGIRVKATKYIRCDRFLEFDGGNQTQDMLARVNSSKPKVVLYKIMYSQILV